MINNNPDAILDAVSSEELPPDYHRFHRRRVTESQLSAICTSKTPQGTIAVIRLSMQTAKKAPDTSRNKIILLEDVQDMRNVSSIIRTAVAFDYSPDY
jgi:tRNA G18 (ribose-2'-O)-methylase SpoU